MTGSRSSRRDELARQIWWQMSELVRDHDRSRELQDALGLGRGTGRVRILLALVDGGRSLGDLAHAIGSDPPYVTLIVNELHALGLVTRVADEADRRRRLIQLTDAGQTAERRAREILGRPPEQLLAFSRAELAQLHAMLQTLAA